MVKVDYIKKLKGESDFGLYKLAKKFHSEDLSGFKHNNRKLQLVYEECLIRDKTIFNMALIDAIYFINSREDAMGELKVIDIKRIDYMSKRELYDYLKSIGAARKNPSLDLDSIEQLDIVSALGIRKGTVFCRVSGQSMVDARIFDGDTLIVDTSVDAGDGVIVVASLNNELFVKRLKKSNGEIWLISENKDYPDLQITNQMDFKIIGVVKNTLRTVD